MNKRIVSMIRKLSKTEQEISLTELAEEFQISQRTESDRRVFLLSLVNYITLMPPEKMWYRSRLPPMKNAMPFLARSSMNRSTHTNVS